MDMKISHFSKTLITVAFSKGCQLNAKWLSYERLNARVSQLQDSADFHFLDNLVYLSMSITSVYYFFL